MKNKQYDINDIYLLHIIEQSFYIPMYEGEYYFHEDIGVNKDFYIVALKKNGLYVDLNSLRRFKGNEKFGFGYIDYIDRIIPLTDVFKNEDMLYNIEIKEAIDKIMINSNNKVLKKMRGNRCIR